MFYIGIDVAKRPYVATAMNGDEAVVGPFDFKNA